MKWWNPLSWFRKKPKDIKLEALDYKVTYLLSSKMIEFPKPVFATEIKDNTQFVLSVDDVKELVQVVIKHCRENM